MFKGGQETYTGNIAPFRERRECPARAGERVRAGEGLFAILGTTIGAAPGSIALAGLACCGLGFICRVLERGRAAQPRTEALDRAVSGWRARCGLLLMLFAALFLRAWTSYAPARGAVLARRLFLIALMRGFAVFHSVMDWRAL